MRVAVVDGQGGGIGRKLIEKINAMNIQDIEILALGTNSIATSGMMKAGANLGATGENPIVINVSKVDVILGPLAIIIPNSIMGEITPRMSFAIGNSNALKILIPLNRCGTEIAGTRNKKINELLEDAAEELLRYYNTTKVN